ncbi:MAG: DNA methyltransferase [Acidimicrobiaceae bacterium]|nr:DNA methyltransferase [Acidimicrobiaceae bacterium]MDE0515853.1 DNA methyltransferase [Acidimicrobiaceae bacterium]MDE0657844.1 DNA methyltransferase [Acidimicrobiaceae bacterium]
MISLPPFYSTLHGEMIHGDAADAMASLAPGTANLVMTSPPFALIRKKAYGNEAPDDYLQWFRPFAAEIYRILDDSGSFVIDIGGSWIPGTPTRSLYHFKLLIMLCEEYGFHLAQEFYWWNPSKLPTPAEWVTIRRLRAKDAVNTVWWLSKTPWPKANNRRVLQPYSQAMRTLITNGYRPKVRPSGHDISPHFTKDNGAAIPPNLLAIPNTESNSSYLRYCKERGIQPHPARFPTDLPEFFIRLTTDADDLVIDPFAGSCATGEVAERLCRRWLCIDSDASYLEGAKGRFEAASSTDSTSGRESYSVPRPSVLWNGMPTEPLPADGGRTRSSARTDA